MTNMPTFVCVPGAWNGPSCYEPLKSILEAENYECVTISLPSVGCKPVTFDFTEDVDAVRRTIQKLADEGKDIILVLHSYGGMCGSQALEGLAKKERESQGLQDGVVRSMTPVPFCAPLGTEPKMLDTPNQWFHDHLEKDTLLMRFESCVYHGNDAT